jgi:hypothetical protein
LFVTQVRETPAQEELTVIVAVAIIAVVIVFVG